MSKHTEEFVLKYKICEKFRKSNCNEPLINHPPPDRPWQKLATDLFQYGSNDYLVLTDYYSRWIEVVTLESKTAIQVIKKLKSIFDRFGIPDVLISDNVPFNSIEFKNFARKVLAFSNNNDKPHRTIIHFQSNGLAEKSVSIIKN